MARMFDTLGFYIMNVQHFDFLQIMSFLIWKDIKLVKPWPKVMRAITKPGSQG